MWLDDHGVCHTVALPDPTELMSGHFRKSLDELLARGIDEVAELVEAEEIRFYEQKAERFPSQFDETHFVGVVPPEPLLVEPMRTVQDLRRLIREIDDRWRLDALVAVTDYVDTAGELKDLTKT